MEYRIIDTHCHPQFPQYDPDRDAVLRRALEAGVGMVCIGTDLHTSRQAIELAGRYEGLYASVGLHPNDNLEEAYDDAAYEELAKNPKVVAIGEIGLDHFRTTDMQLKKKQQERFIRQLELSRRVKLPVVIHCRDAHDDMLDVLGYTQNNAPQAQRIHGVLHSFNGSVAHARSYLDGGFVIGLNAIATFSKSYEEMIRYIPADRLVLETDSPYLAPAPHRGARNEPLYIEAVGNYLAAIRGVEPTTLLNQTTANARALYNI